MGDEHFVTGANVLRCLTCLTCWASKSYLLRYEMLHGREGQKEHRTPREGSVTSFLGRLKGAFLPSEEAFARTVQFNGNSTRGPLGFFQRCIRTGSSPSLRAPPMQLSIKLTPRECRKGRRWKAATHQEPSRVGGTKNYSLLSRKIQRDAICYDSLLFFLWSGECGQCLVRD